MAEKEDIKNLEKSNKSDFTQLNATLKQNNDAEDKRDKRRLDQATAHSQKSEKNLQALKGVVTSTESESTTKELKSDKQTRSDAGKQHKKRNSADIKKDKTEKVDSSNATYEFMVLSGYEREIDKDASKLLGEALVKG